MKKQADKLVAAVNSAFEQHDLKCAEPQRCGVDLRLRRFMEKLSKDGDRIMVPGKPDESEMVSQIRNGDMPPKSEPLAFLPASGSRVASLQVDTDGM